MSHPPEAIQALRVQGVRITPQREAVLCALYTLGGHVTAERVYELASRSMPHVGLATIYRNLEFLTEQGVVAVTDLGDGRMEWELVSERPHHHAVCRRCGDVTQLEHALVRGLEDGLRDALGFQADLSHMAIFGLCAGCQKDGSSD